MAPDTQTRRAGLPHAVFLQRPADDGATSPEVRLGQGAFLTLRFVDLLDPAREASSPDVFRYQWAATERYCSELASEGAEAAHLTGIVRATGETHRLGDVRLLAPALLAYAMYLEQEGHLEEAEDVLLTLERVGGDRLRSNDAIAVWMRLGRVRRLRAEFDQASAAYAEAGRIAAATGDRQALLLSRVGHCNTLYFRGNLADAETGWRDILSDAKAGGFRSVEAQAEQGLGNALARRGQPHEGAPHLWRSYELYEDESARLRALNDLGIMLLTLGDVGGAERALTEVVNRERMPDNRTNAVIELMHCASFRRDRVGFERWRERGTEFLESALPNARADYHLKAGVGLARFGNYRRAEAEMRVALEIASAHQLHEMVFRIERILSGLGDCESLAREESTVTEPTVWTEELREVSASLATLSA